LRKMIHSVVFFFFNRSDDDDESDIINIYYFKNLNICDLQK